MNLQPKELGDAVAHWLEYKTICGFESLLSEALLVTPISEYLIGKGWQVSAERDYRTVFGRNLGAGYLNYDIDAVRNEGKLIVEVKYLKIGKGKDSGPAIATGRIFEDIAKLAFPSDMCRRLLIVGRAANVTSYSAIGTLLGSKKSIVRFPNSAEARVDEISYKFRDGITNAIRALNEGGLPSLCEVELLSSGESDRRAFVFEVSRST